MVQIDWTAIVVGVLSLLGCCAWFIEGRKHKPTAKGLATDNKLKEMELGQLYVDQFEKNIANPLRQEVRELRDEVKELRDAIQRIDRCPHRDMCPVYDGMRKQQAGDEE